MRLAIIDDEKKESNKLKRAILHWQEKTDGAAVYCLFFDSGEAFLEQMQPGQFDLIFIDIYMAALDGVATVEALRKRDPQVLVVFTTTSREHIFDAARLHFFDYLVKPYAETQVFHVLDEAAERLNQKQAETCTFDIDGATWRVPYDRLYYILSDNHHVIIGTADGRKTLRLSFSKATEGLTDARFLTINRGVLVNLDHVTRADSKAFVMTDGESLPPRRRDSKKLLTAYSQYLFDKVE